MLQSHILNLFFSYKARAVLDSSGMGLVQPYIPWEIRKALTGLLKYTHGTAQMLQPKAKMRQNQVLFVHLQNAITEKLPI